MSREFRIALPWELLYSHDFIVIAESKEELIKKLNQWKNKVEGKGMKVKMNKNKAMISGECCSWVQNTGRWPYGVCCVAVARNSIQCIAEMGAQKV